MPHKIDSSRTDEIVCPYCGYEFEDSWECDDEGTIECDCGKNFLYHSESEIHYWSERDCKINGEKHEWEFKMDLSKATMEKCANCDQTRFLEKEPDTTLKVCSAY